VKGRGTCGSGERNVKIWINFRKSSRFSLTSPLSQEREKSSCPVFTICGEPFICTFFFVFYFNRSYLYLFFVSISTGPNCTSLCIYFNGPYLYLLFGFYFNRSYLYLFFVSISTGPICILYVSISMGPICTPFSYLYQRIKFVPRFRIYLNKSNLYPIFVSTSTGPTCTCFRIYYRLITFDYMQYQSFLCTLISHFYLTVKFIPFWTTCFNNQNLNFYLRIFIFKCYKNQWI
jgi:hypothetical protein